jgi:hypothetical protein
MKNALMPLTAMVGLILGLTVWPVNATPLPIPTPSQDKSQVETIGCTRSGDNCPIGFAIKRHGGGSWSCVPCGNQRYGYRDRDEEYYGPRRYREYDDRYYAPRYPREYY